MKKFIAIALIGMLALPIFAQNKPERSEEKNVIKLNTLSLIIGTGSVFYERHLTDNISGQLGVGYLNYSIGDGDDKAKFTGLFLTPEVRIYPFGNAIDGMYIGPYFRYFNLSLSDDIDKASYTNLGGGATLGRQWIFNSGFTIDLFVGGHYGKGSLKLESGTETFDTDLFEGFRTRFGFALGFAF
jgi:hypothetical protein